MKRLRLVGTMRALTQAALAIAVGIVSQTSRADFVERIGNEANPGIAVKVPGFEKGKWRTRTQLVWDARTQLLIRRTYSLWDPLSSEELDYVWVPEDLAADHEGPITGRGRITWRASGAAVYDSARNTAEYRGDMVGGRAQGHGEYVHRSGVRYRGAWRNGLMHGEGSLRLPNGDHYIGSFSNGRPDGPGTYSDASGTVYTGDFASGLREGKGIVHLPDGRVYRAVWQAGREILGSRDLVTRMGPRSASVFAVQYDQIDELRIRVLVDNQLSFGGTDSRQSLTDMVSLLEYSEESVDERLQIFPKDLRLIDVWRGRAELQLTGDETFQYYHSPEGQPSFLGTRSRYGPVAMIFELENAAQATVRISGAFIDVARSVSDRDPAVQLIAEDAYSFDRCGTSNLLNSSSFRLENYGWTSAESAEISFSFDSDSGQRGDPIIREIGTIQDSVTVDLGPDLARQGVAVDDLSEREVPCPTTSAMADTGDRDMASATACIAKEGQLFGKLAKLVSVSGDLIGVTAVGTLRYHWTDAADQSHLKTSPFKQWLPLGRLANTAGCFGEMGAPDDIVGTSRKSFSFRLDKQNYRIGIPLTDDVPAGVTGRWRITLDAPQTSHHTFRIVLELVDGRRVASRPIELLYFVPSR